MILPDDVPEEIAAWIAAQRDTDGPAALNTVVVMYSYLDDAGAPGWNYHVRGESSVFSVIGLVEIVKNRMMTPITDEGLREMWDDE